MAPEPIYDEEFNQLMNDECIAHIFQYLSAKDLIALSKTTRQFRRVTIEVMPKIHAYVELKEISPCATISECAYILKLFGKSLKGFSVDAFGLKYHTREWKMLKLMLETFTYDSKLEQLKLENFYSFSLQTLNLITPIFNKLKKLTLVRMSLPITVALIMYRWPNIQELSLVYCHKADERNRVTTKSLLTYPLNFVSHMKKLELMRNSYVQILPLMAEAPNIFTDLEELSVHPALFGESMPFQMDFIIIMVALTRISTLKILKLDLEFKDMTILLDSVAMNLPHLHTLDISYASYHPTSIIQFHKLRYLKTLRLFSIHGFKKHHIKPIVSGMPGLTTLDVHCRINLRTLFSIVRDAPHLAVLDVEMHSKYAITQHAFGKLLEIVKSQQRDEKLTIKIYNHNIMPMTTKELRIVNNSAENPFLHISRWP